MISEPSFGAMVLTSDARSVQRVWLVGCWMMGGGGGGGIYMVLFWGLGFGVLRRVSGEGKEEVSGE